LGLGYDDTRLSQVKVAPSRVRAGVIDFFQVRLG